MVEIILMVIMLIMLGSVIKYLKSTAIFLTLIFEYQKKIYHKISGELDTTASIEKDKLIDEIVKMHMNDLLSWHCLYKSNER